MIPRVKGTHDCVDLTLFNFVIDAVKKHVQKYRFTEIQTPILEHVELFNRSLGEHTDVVTKEMFLLEQHAESSEGKMCLRPEGTAPIVRTFLEQHNPKTPWKVFMCGPMFRYERPQKGRYRQFNQVTMEIIGSNSVSEDAQFIVMLDRFFHEVIGINSYALAINYLGCSQDRKAYTALLHNFLTEAHAAVSICEQCTYRKEHNILRIFDCKNSQCQEIYKKAPFIADHLCAPCTAEWHQLQEQLSLLSISHLYQPTLVRGLDYYSKTVFEFISKNIGAQGTFCGGGRYNHLAVQLGARHDYPSIGAAFGVERLLLLLEPVKNNLALPQLPPLHIIIPLTEQQHTLALLLADSLVAQGLCIDVLFEGSIKSMMRKADGMGATFVIVIGESEQLTKTAMIKNMLTGQEQLVAQIDVAAYLLKEK